MHTAEQIIQQTRKWITDVVIGCHFCPFAAKELKQDSIHYQVEPATDLAICLEAFLKECRRLDQENTATTLLIFSNGFEKFDDFLDLADLAEALLQEEGYEGIYQVAGFHPLYLFDQSSEDDAANYTNRSIYPMLHLLREEAVELALQTYPEPEKIPERNILFTRKKGLAYMKLLRDACLQPGH